LTKSTQKISEAELVDWLQRKDKKGFEMLYDNYSPALYGVITKIVRSEEVAADVLQDTFVKIWQRIDSYDASKGRLFTWILNIARNTAIDRIRSQDFKHTANSQPLEQTLGTLDQQVNAQPAIEHIGLQKVIDTLKPEHQSIIDLLYFKGYTQAEAAEELDIPLGTLKTRVKLAMNQLRAFFK
jgi:RNA polymerase sigma-70 factor, ECF subfamily